MRTRIAVLALSVLFLCLPVVAQDQPPPDLPHIQFSGNYSFVRTSLADKNGDNEAAWSASTAVRLGSKWSARFDVIKLNAPGDTQIYVGGPEYRILGSKLHLPSSQSFNAEKAEFFVHSLLGAVRHKDTTGEVDSDFALVLGGGLDYPLPEGFSVRVFQLEYVRAPIVEPGFVLRNNFRVSSGLNFSF